MDKDKNTIFLTFTSHIDLPWLWRIPESIETWKNTSESVLDLMEKYPEFYFVQSSAQGYRWMEKKYPEIFNRIAERVKDGRWSIVGGMWVEPDCNMPGGESFVRNILYGKFYFKEKFGVNPRIAFVPDSFGYAKTLPQIFANSGFDWFVTQKLRWNATNEFPYDVFRWYGLDGSSIKVYIPYRYDDLLDNEKRLAREFEKYKDKTGLANLLVLAGMGDHGGGPNEPMLIRARNLKVDGVDRISNTKIEDFLRKLDCLDLPSYNDELYLEYHQGAFTTNAKTKKLNRNTEIILEELEKFSSMSVLETGDEYKKNDIKEIWEKALLNQFHDMLSGTCIKEAHEDAYNLYDEIMNSSRNILDGSISRIAECVDTEGDGIPVIVFNPLSFKRKDVVEFDISLGSTEYDIYDKNENLMVSNYDNGKLSFIAENVPSIGYKTFWVRRGTGKKLGNKIKASNFSLENKFYKIELDEKTGNLSRLFDKRLRRDILEERKHGNVLEAFEDMPNEWDAWNIGYTGHVKEINDIESVSLVENNAVRAKLRVAKRFGDSKFTQDIVAYSNLERIDIVNDVHWKEKHTLLKAAFPLSVESSYATYEIPYGIIERPTIPRNSFEAAKFEVPGGKWADLSNSSLGVSLFNDSKYGWDVRRNVMRLTLLRSPTYPNPNEPHIPIKENDDSYFTDLGEHIFTYSLYSHKGDWRHGNSLRKANELNYKLVPLVESQHKGTLPPEKSFARVTQNNFLITAIKPAEESDDFVFRFYENFGKLSKADIYLPKIPKKVYLSDLLENRNSEVAFSKNKVSIPARPYEIKTLLASF